MSDLTTGFFQAGDDWLEPWCEDHPDGNGQHCLACTGASHDAWMHRAKAAETRVAELEAENLRLLQGVENGVRLARYGEAREKRLAELERRDAEWRTGSIAVHKERDAARQRVAELEAALRACGATDRSDRYEYGEADRDGRVPERGQRWNTPKEIARDALRGKK